ncbi:MAG: MFS transporter [Nitratireductor sp.]|nr:MFS transporter [Nitratireductor sp.]
MEQDVVKTESMEQSTPRSRYWAVSGIILSSSLMAMASGLAFAYIPIKLLSLGFEPWVPASMTPALALGGLAGCFATGPLLRHSGHARIFMLFYAMLAMSMAAIALFTSPWAWVVARMGYGFAINGVFIVAQSWLHHASTDDIRGKVISIFYVAYVVALGSGGFLVGYVESEGNSIPILASFFVAAAMIPVALTSLPQPEAPEAISVDIRRVWKISPVGLAGMFAVGGATMLLQSIAPIYMTELGHSRSDVGLMMLLMQLGLICIQIPMGALSDRIDRRIVLAIVSGGAMIVAMTAFSGHGSTGLILLILLFALWNGFNETIYSVSSALANDRANPADYVMLSSTQMIAWSTSAFIVPLIATVALAFAPVQYFMPAAAVISGLFMVFVIIRMFKRRDVAPADKDAFQPITSQVAYPGDYANPDAYDDDNSGASEGLIG